jgi:multidrug efflux pump subunit AcrA (membrane-fusion protein)
MKLFSKNPFRFPVQAVLLGLFLAAAGCGGDKQGDQPDQVYEVEQGSFNIVISANGTLDAIKRYRIDSPPVAKEGLDIIEAVDDQTPLKKGDLILAFSDEKYLDALESKKAEIEEAEKNLMLVKQDMQMEAADSIGKIIDATDAYRVASESFEKYTDEDAPLQKKDLIADLETARQNLLAEQEILSQLKDDLLSASMGDQGAQADIESKIESSKKKIENLENEVERKAYNRRIFKQYSFPQKTREHQGDVVKAEMRLREMLLDAAAERLQVERKISTQQRKLDWLRRQRDELIDNISMLRITAPVDGVITYGDPDPRRRRREQKDITVGASMRPSEVIGSIPDMSRLVVNLDIPEATRPKIRAGMRAEMRVKALPNIQLSGEVSRISDMASNLNYWDRTSPKIYETVISIDQNLEVLRPGMSVEVDMISETVSDVIFVPVEALYVKEGDVYCQVKKAAGQEERIVRTGRSSSSFVEITEGLKSGDKVLLSREER